MQFFEIVASPARGENRMYSHPRTSDATSLYSIAKKSPRWIFRDFFCNFFSCRITCARVATYRKIPVISRRLISYYKAVLLGLFYGELIFGGAYYWKEFCVSKWVGLDNKKAWNITKRAKTASTNSPWAYIRKGLLSEGFLGLRFGGGFFFLGGGLIIGILRYAIFAARWRRNNFFF